MTVNLGTKLFYKWHMMPHNAVQTLKPRSGQLLFSSSSGTRVFSGLYQEHVYDEEFPDFSETWADLGLKIRYNRVTLLPGAPLTSVRDAIMDG